MLEGSCESMVRGSQERRSPMRVSDILRGKGAEVVTIEEHRTVHDAICKLNEHGIGALVVTGQDGEISGIITERDILRECGTRCVRLVGSREPEESDCPSLVQDAMTKHLIIGVPEDDLNYVMSVMTKNRIRHLPIVEGKELAGMVSIGDVVNAHVNETEFENRMLKDYIHGVTY
jgi:CBS domain-containing protein